MTDASLIIFRIILSVLAIIISSLVIPYLKTKVDNDKWGRILDIVMEAVLAAEQILREPGSGEEKKKMVVDFVSKWLSDRGIIISAYELDTLIEAAVKKMKEKEA